MKDSELFRNSSPDELKRGYIQDENYYVCLLCGKKIEKGIIYSEAGVFYEAEKYIRIHIANAHQSVFEHLINLNKKFTGLTDHQNSLLKLFYQGKSDSEIRDEMGIGSSSTIRNHRFILKEKERQSKVFSALMELLKEKNKHADFQKKSVVSDDRFNITPEENESILKKYFSGGADSRLATIPAKEKHRFAVLREIAARFQGDRPYNEKEINRILCDVNDDYVTLRRYLIEYGFLDRKPDGSLYWLKEKPVKTENNKMDRKQELKRLYKEMKTEAGIYQIKNTINQKILVVAAANLKTINGKRFGLQRGVHMNKALQNELNEFGPDAFAFEILEILEKKEEGFFDLNDALKKLEKKWLDKLQPYGERGYNTLKPDNTV